MLVLERQIRSAIAEGEEIKAKPYDEGWGVWETNLRDLINRALGSDSPQARSFYFAGGIVADGPERRSFYSTQEYMGAMASWRNGKVDRYLASANGSLKAIAQELERRGALPQPVSLPARDFTFVQNTGLRAIASRDYGELQSVAETTVKATALLAGSIIEALLFDALQQKGVSQAQLDGMDFYKLIDSAEAAGLIQDRTKKAAHAVRDTRNFVHPAVELGKGALRDVDAKTAIALMNQVFEDLL